jgi:hypothetical protein
MLYAGITGIQMDSYADDDAWAARWSTRSPSTPA